MEPDLICQQIAPQLDSYHDGELGAEEKAGVEKHLATCTHCVGKLAEIDRVVHSLKTIPRQPMPQGLSAKLDSMIDAASAGTGGGASAGGGNVLPLRSRFFLPLTAAAAVVALVIGIKFFAPGTQAPETAHVDKNNAPQVAANQRAPEQIQPQPAIQHDVATQPEHPVVADKPVAPERTSHVVPHPGVEVALVTPEHAKPHAKSVAPAPEQIAARNNSTGAEVQVAELPSGTNSFNEAVGIATDEDGLYDIKM
jgi:hypothetical protein